MDDYLEKLAERRSPVLMCELGKNLIAGGEVEKGVSLLLETLDTNAELSRIDAADILGQIGAKVAIEPLTKLLKTNSNKAQFSAACALGKLGYKDKHVLEILNTALKHDRNYIRASSAYSLWALNDKTAVKSLIEDVKYAERVAIICFMSDQFRIHRDESSVELLISWLSCEPVKKVLKSVAKALNEITGNSFTFGNTRHDKWLRWWHNKHGKFS